MMMDDDVVMMMMTMNGDNRDGGGGVQCQQPSCGGPWTQCPLSIMTDT